MFSQFLNQVDGVISEAKASRHIIKESFGEVYDAIESYVKDNNLILSSPEALIKQEKTTFSKFTIYGDNIFRHANNLANIIAAINIYVLMYTNVKNEDFTISVDGGALVQLYNVRRNLLPTINPVKIGGINMYPYELELIGIYNKLYSPEFADDWDKLDDWERKMFKHICERRQILGGKRRRRSGSARRSAASRDESGRSTNAFDGAVVFNWLKGRDDYILVGVNAVNILTDSPPDHPKIQAITANCSFVNEVSNLIKQATGITPRTKTNKTNIPTEPRSSKTTISIAVPNGRGKQRTVHIMDVFNAATYELVPFSTYNDLQVGHKNVLKMYFLVDLWFYRILFSLNFIKETVLKKNVAACFHNLEKIEGVPQDILGREYLGIHSDIVRYKKKIGTQNVFYPYNPEQHRYIKGKYREI
jgi:hypothetical protein